MKHFFIKIFLLTVCFVAVNNVELVSQSFSASVSSKTVGLNDQFEVIFTIFGDDVNNVKNFRAPDFKNFLTLMGPSQSTSMQIINGAVSASVSFTYVLQPREIGEFTIGSAAIEYKGQSLKSEPIKIEVIKGAAKPKQQQGEIVSSQEISENVFIKAFADRQKVLNGEQVTVTYKLYTAVGISAPQISKLPSYQGFWVEEIETSSNISFDNEVVNGKQFKVGVLKKVALFPTQTGELSVTPFELKLQVAVQTKRKRGNIFDDFFNDPFFNRQEMIEYTAKSNVLKITSLPLPQKNVPDKFDGAVGQFNLNAEVDKSSVKLNEPFTLTLTLSGTGNIKLLTPPELQLPPGFEKYDPKTNEQINRTGKISGRKAIEYLIIPRTIGPKEIPAVKFYYFDPNRNEYVTLSTKSYTINVEQGESRYAENISNYSKEDIKLLSDDIRYIKISYGGIYKKSGYLFGKPGFWTAAIFPLIALMILVMWKKKEERISGNTELLRFRRAEKIAKNKLKKAKKLIDENDQSGFYTELSQALFGYFEDKLKISKAEFTLDLALYRLQEKKLDDNLIMKIKNCAEKCEFVRFAPKGNGLTEMRELYDEVAQIIINMEKAFS